MSLNRKQLRQCSSMVREIMEEEERRDRLGVYSLFGDDCAMLEKYRGELLRISQWIACIPDSMTRRAFRLRYVDNLSWVTVSVRLGYTSESGARVLCERYLQAQRDVE